MEKNEIKAQEEVKIFRFKADIADNFTAEGPKPIYDEYGTLVGGFVADRGDEVQCFVSGTGYPSAIQISSGSPFFFTPRLGTDGFVNSAVVSEGFLSRHKSVRIDKASEENA